MKQIVLPAIIFVFMLNHLFAQPVSRSLGNAKSMKKISNGIIINTDFGNVKVIVFSADVFKIDITKNASFNDFSYATVASPRENVHYDLKENKNDFTISTDSLIMMISKKPVRISFYTKNNKLINADDSAFGTSWIDEEISTYKKLFKTEKFIGLGEKTGDLDRRGNSYTNWNTDAFGYQGNTDPIYSSIPFYIGLHDSLMYGIFLDNSSKTQFNFGASQNRMSYFMTEHGDMNYFFIYHTSIPKIIESYTWLTGRMPLPPLWSLGFHQCRYSYYPDTKALNIAQTFRDKKIPCDVIWFDIHYMQDYKVFTWDSIRFPQPKMMMDKMDQLGFKNVCIIDPGIKVENGYAQYDDGVKQNVFLKYPDGTVYNGAVWPGWCAFTDYSNPSGREWWGKQFKNDIDEGMDGFWCDMNEIASWGQRTPENVVFNFDGHPTTYSMGKNIFGFQMARATYEGTKKLFNDKRPFVLTRAGFAGLQRYTAIWTGDNQATDDHMLLGVRLVNSLGLSGVAFAGVDVGGFAGEATPDLMARWVSIGAFTPFFRCHKVIDAKDAEPWAFGEKTESTCRNYIQLRYNLLPYIYSAFYEATQDGMPVQRSLAINYPFDATIYKGNAVNEYLFGNGLLVVPYVSTQQTAKIYLPAGEWYDLYSNDKHTGLDSFYMDAPVEKLPVFVKGGSIIPMQSPIQTTAEKPTDTLTIHIYNGSSANDFVYYEDAGNGYEYQNGGYYKRIICIRSRQKTSSA